MSCRAISCNGREWMARKFCDRHWKMLPVDLQIQIRKALEWNRRCARGDERDLQPMFDQAQAIITERELQQAVTARVGLFRTHMASVAGVVAALRTIPIRELQTQLTASREAHQQNDEVGFELIRARVDFDLALLEVLGETSEKLGAVIKRFAPVPAEVDA